jgi:hypothetical protein
MNNNVLWMARLPVFSGGFAYPGFPVPAQTTLNQLK